jgi:pantothenate kinase
VSGPGRGPEPGEVEALADRLAARAFGHSRFVVGLAGPPGAGKSTLAAALVAALEHRAPGEVALVAMDGFHLDNAVLAARGHRARKGAPETFDVAGYRDTLIRIRTGNGEVAVPVFDRDLDLARAGAAVVGPHHRIIVTEGNYLLLDLPPWDGLGLLVDYTVFIAVPEEALHQRLLQRWLDYGLAPDVAAVRADGNDMVNARLVLDRRRAANDEWGA